jgi:hypothetical protein
VHRCPQQRRLFLRGLRAIAAFEGPQFRQPADTGERPRKTHGLAAFRADRRRFCSFQFQPHTIIMRAVCPARFEIDQSTRAQRKRGDETCHSAARSLAASPKSITAKRGSSLSMLPSGFGATDSGPGRFGAPRNDGPRPRVDTRYHRPTLILFRGELREELRDRRCGNPLNLIRVMPAKGQEYP